MPNQTTDFFIAGGTLAPDSPSYVERPADDELFKLVQRGHLCYVLTPRQMGKSSLMSRTAARLKEQGVSTAIIDLTSIGTDTVTVEQWYVGQLDRLKEGLQLSVDPMLWWQERALLPPVQRFTNFLRDIVLTEVAGQVVIFIDEIDATLNFDFRDDFFAAIRAMYNARANNPDLKRLTFVLLGVASPPELIKDHTRTPFNVGEGIALEEFSQDEAETLQKGLKAVYPQQAQAIFERIYHWTSGYPYLTQKLCREVAQSGQRDWSNEQIDRLVEKHFLSEAAIRDETHLKFIQERILKSPQRRQLLNLYGKVYNGQEVTDEPQSPIQNQLKLSGLVKAENGSLQTRNEIYRGVFDLEWVKENTAIDWVRVFAGVAVLVAGLAIGLLLQNTWVDMQSKEAIDGFYQPNTSPTKRVTYLATLFQLRGFVPATDYDYRAKELFYDLSWDEQLALFEDYNGEDTHLTHVVEGIYTTLADVNGTNSNGPLLKAMASALNRQPLEEEINYWLEAREMVRQGEFDQALKKYEQAIARNAQNPATLYERARVQIALSNYEGALTDLDQVIVIAKREPTPTPTPIPTSTYTPISSPIPTYTPTALPASINTPNISSSPTRTAEGPAVTESPLGTGTRTVTAATATQLLLPTETTQPSVTSTVTPTATGTSIVVPVDQAPFTSQFITTNHRINAVKNLIDNNQALALVLVEASSAGSDVYSNLQEFGLVPTPTFTPSPTRTPSPILTPPVVILSTIQRIRDRDNTLIAGVKFDFPPFGYLDNGELAGFDVDLIQAMADEWGIEVEFAQVTSADRIPKLAAGEVDILAASMTHKKDREEQIDFSQTYFLDGQSLLVRQDSGMTGIQDLDGKTVTAIEGSTSIEQIESYAAANGVTIDVLPFLEYSQALEALKAGSVDALTTHSVALNQFAQDNPELIVVGGLFTEEPYGMGVPVGDSYFRNLVDFTLQKLKANGKYDELYTKWFGTEATPYEIEQMPGEWAYTFLGSPLDLRIPEQSIVDKIESEGRFVAGVKFDLTPFGFLDESDSLVGFDVDIMKEFARRWVGDENAVEFVKVTSSDRIPKLAAGEVDIVAASMTHTKQRDERIDFSQTYFLDGQSLLVRADSGINGLADLDGKRVAAIEDSTSINNMQAKANELGITIDMLPFVEYDAALQAFKAGQVDALSTNSATLSQSAQENPNLIVVGGRFTNEPYGMGVSNFDHRFRDLVNFTLQAMKEDGTYDRLYQKWFGNDAPYAVELWPGEADYLSVPYESSGDGTSGSSAAASDSLSKIQRIRERGNLLLAGVKYDFMPFGFLDENNQLVGFEIDLIQAMANEWGVEVEFVQATSSGRIPQLVAGEVDIIAASMTHKKERDETIDFSQTYFVDGQRLLVRKDSGIEGIEGLNGKTISAIAGSTSIDNIQAYADANDITIEILPFEEYPPAIESLKAGIVDALTTDSVALLQFAQDNPELAVVGDLFTIEPYGMGLPPGDSYFNNLVNFTLQDLKVNGTFDELYQKWFDAKTPYIIELMPGEWPYTFANSPTSLDRPIQSKVEMILSQGGFMAGVKFNTPPFGFLDESGDLVGFDIDLMKEFARRWLGDEKAVEFVQVTSSDRIPKLAAGEVDIIAAAMTHTKSRDEFIDFSQTYFLDGQKLLVREESGISSVTDLDSKIVAAIQGSTSLENLQAQADKLGISIAIVPFSEYPRAIEALKAGEVDALTTNSSLLEYFAQQNGPRLAVVGQPFSSEPYGLGLPNYDDRFRDLVNFTLQEMKEDGSYDRIYAKWFGSGGVPYPIEIWPGNTYLDTNITPMVRIPASQFIRGSNEGLENEAPEQTIYLDEFYIDQYEVTNRLYAQCVTAESCKPPQIERAVSSVEYFASPAFGNYPVVWVTWENARSYCEFAGKRLPTEAEWEKAARGSESLTYPWGNEEPSPDRANFIGSGHIDTVPIGSHSTGVSPYGVHDMAGNVREWVNDWYAGDYYQNAPKENPPGASQGITKVVRGGAWNDAAADLRTTRRKDFLPESFDGGLGFRCASSTFPPRR